MISWNWEEAFWKASLGLPERLRSSFGCRWNEEMVQTRSFDFSLTLAQEVRILFLKKILKLLLIVQNLKRNQKNRKILLSSQEGVTLSQRVPIRNQKMLNIKLHTIKWKTVKFQAIYWSISMSKWLSIRTLSTTISGRLASFSVFSLVWLGWYWPATGQFWRLAW